MSQLKRSRIVTSLILGCTLSIMISQPLRAWPSWNTIRVGLSIAGLFASIGILYEGWNQTKKEELWLRLHPPKLSFAHFKGTIPKKLQEIATLYKQHENGTSHEVRPNKILLSGPSGSGKTALAHALAGELCDGVRTLNSEVLKMEINQNTAESYLKLQIDLAAVLIELGKCTKIALIFDSIDFEEEADRKAFNKLIKQIDVDSSIVLICTTGTEASSYNAFDRHIKLTLPTFKQRKELLDAHCGTLVATEKLARATKGLTYRDLNMLIAWVLNLPRTYNTQERRLDAALKLIKTVIPVIKKNEEKKSASYQRSH